MVIEGPEELRRMRELGEELVLVARSDVASAQDLLEQMDLLAANRAGQIFEAFVIRARGNLLQVQGKLVEAASSYRAAVVLFAESNDRVELARTASSLVGVLAALGEFEEAMRLAEKARSIFEEENLAVRAARLDVNVGNLHHRLGRLDDALRCYERAASVLVKSEDAEAVAGVLINRSIALMLLYRFNEALDGFNEARAYCESHGLPSLSTQSEYNRAYLLYLTGDSLAALKGMQAAESEFSSRGDLFHVAQCCLDRAEILMELNVADVAEEVCVRADEIFSSLKLDGDRARSLLLLGRCALRMGGLSEAADRFLHARRLFEKEQNRIWAHVADLEQATALLAEDRLRESWDLAWQALEVFHEEGHLPFEIVGRLACARIAVESRDGSKALELVQSCEEVIENPPAWLQYQVEYLRGRIQELEDDTAEALRAFERAAESLELLRDHIRIDEITVRFLENRADLYQRLVRLAPDAETAFAYAERGKGHVLSASMRRENRARSARNVSERVRQARENLQSGYIRLFKKDEVHPDQLLKDIREKELHLRRELLDADIRQATSVLAVGTPKPTMPHISTDEVLLEYFLTESASFVFVVRNGSVERIRLRTTTSDLEEEIIFLRFQLASFSWSRERTALNHHLRRLYDLLIAPVESMLAFRVVIVPHRCLHNLPFHALMAPWGYFTERHVISYAPSAAAYETASSRAATTECTSLILAVDVSGLPAIRRELDAVARHLPNASILRGGDIGEIRTALASAGIVHIASHGIFRSEGPARSLLMLGPDTLTPDDLEGLNLNAELVTISACSTARSRISAADELQGFVRAFLALRVPSLVASLWDVSDEATASLMGRFYEGFAATPDIAENLRQAMLSMKTVFDHPFYWAGFVLIGKTQLGQAWNYFRENIKENRTGCTNMPLIETDKA